MVQIFKLLQGILSGSNGCIAYCKSKLISSRFGHLHCNLNAVHGLYTIIYIYGSNITHVCVQHVQHFGQVNTIREHIVSINCSICLNKYNKEYEENE